MSFIRLCILGLLGALVISAGAYVYSIKTQPKPVTKPASELTEGLTYCCQNNGTCDVTKKEDCSGMFSNVKETCEARCTGK